MAAPQVITKHPPNYADIAAVFPHVRHMEVFFAYAPYVYAPRGGRLPMVLWRHETLHITRQGDHPAEWWERYLTDVAFRREEELVAHVLEAEDRALAGGDNRPARRRALALTASRLSNKLYGPMFRKADAKAALKERLGW